MTRMLDLNPDRLFPSDPTTRAIARTLYAEVAGLPIVSPHGHTDARWFADDAPWTDATALLLAPDHYIFRMLYSQGIDLDVGGSGPGEFQRASHSGGQAELQGSREVHQLDDLRTRSGLHLVVRPVTQERLVGLQIRRQHGVPLLRGLSGGNQRLTEVGQRASSRIDGAQQ